MSPSVTYDKGLVDSRINCKRTDHLLMVSGWHVKSRSFASGLQHSLPGFDDRQGRIIVSQTDRSDRRNYSRLGNRMVWDCVG